MDIRFELNNDQREYLGLDPIQSHWNKVVLKGDKYRKESILYFEGDLLKRHIISDDHLYQETQYNDLTKDRNIILPKTSRGKERKLTASTIESLTPIGVYFHLTIFGYLLIGNHTTQTTFYSSAWEYPNSNEQKSFSESIKNFIVNSPSNHIDDIRKFKEGKRKHVKFKDGDYFAFKISRSEFGFGRVILNISKLKKSGRLPERHGLRFLMGIPVLVQLYSYISNSKNIDLAILESSGTLPSDYIMDNHLLYGEYEIIGNKSMNYKEIDYPISYGKDINFNSNEVFLQWGLIHVSLPLSKYNKYLVGENPTASYQAAKYMPNPYGYYSIGFRPKYSGYEIKDAAVNGFNYSKMEHYLFEFDLRNPSNNEIRKEIFIAFGLDANASYAENCRISNTVCEF